MKKKRTLTSLKSCLSLWMFSEIYNFKKKISLMNMKIFIFMFEGLISKNKEKINIAPSPQGTPLTNNKENKSLKFLSSIIKKIKCWTPLAKKYFLNFFDLHGNFSI